jgi:hypothetical protein
MIQRRSGVGRADEQRQGFLGVGIGQGGQLSASETFLGDPELLVEAWAWLTALSTPVAIVVWVLFLPIAVGLWIWNSSWAPVVGVLLAIGMVAWTLVAVNGVMRALRAR